MKTESDNALYILNEPKLERGDIILSASKNRISKTIKVLTLGSFSHARIYLGKYSYAEAGGPGVRVAAGNIQRLFFNSKEHCCVLRIKENLSEAQMDGVISNARRIIGTQYSLPEAKLVALRVKHKAKELNRQFCSRYVAQAYESIGTLIVENIDYCSPSDIHKSNKLFIIKDPLRVATPMEIKEFRKSSIELSISNKAHDFIFTEASKISGFDIQNFEQFNEVVIVAKEFDTLFAEILHNSGFLDLWKLEMKNQPWLFDFDVLVKTFQDQEYLKYLAKEHLSIISESRKRIIPTLAVLKGNFSQNKLETLKLQIELYKTLVELTNKKEQVFFEVLRTI